MLTILTFSLAAAQSTAGNDSGLGAVVFQNEKADLRNQIEVYPNPAVDNVFVKITASDLEKVEFELFNIIGAGMKIETEEISKNYYRVGVKELPAGYYLLMVKDPAKHFSRAFKIHKANK